MSVESNSPSNSLELEFVAPSGAERPSQTPNPSFSFTAPTSKEGIPEALVKIRTTLRELEDSSPKYKEVKAARVLLDAPGLLERIERYLLGHQSLKPVAIEPGTEVSYTPISGLQLTIAQNGFLYVYIDPLAILCPGCYRLIGDGCLCGLQTSNMRSLRDTSCCSCETYP